MRARKAEQKDGYVALYRALIFCETLTQGSATLALGYMDYAPLGLKATPAQDKPQGGVIHAARGNTPGYSEKAMEH